MTAQLPFCTLDDVKALLPVRAGVTTFDAKIQSLMLVSSIMIETYCRREFDYQTMVETFDTKLTVQREPDFGSSRIPATGFMYVGRPQKIYLSACPIDLTQPVVVKFDPYYGFGDDTILNGVPGANGMSVPDYQVEAGRKNKTPKIILMRGLPKAVRALQVTYTAGYKPDNTNTSVVVDADIRMACALQVLYLWTRNNPDNIGINQDRTLGSPGNKGFHAGTADFEKNSGLCSEAAVLLKDYVRIAKGQQ